MSPAESPPLEGTLVRLVPLDLAHVDALAAIGLDEEIWRWMPYRVRNRDGMRRLVEDALSAQRAGTAIPFATTLRESGAIVGTTRYMNIDLANKRVEIGGTWIAPAWQRTRVNTEAKFLMLTHAFERMGCRRVEFKTHALNARSRAAIARLGATEEGTLRRHMVQEDGSSRDSVYFSIIDDEWPEVKRRLEARLAAR